MKKNVFTYGFFAGSIFVAYIVLLGFYHEQISFDNGMYYTYGAMILAFSFVFGGVKNYRDKYLGGSIGFGKALKIGLLITLIASCFYVLTWFVVHKTLLPNFTTDYANYAIAKAKASGSSIADIEKLTKEMDDFKKMYTNPLVVVLFTFLEVLPIGIVVSLIAALILKKKSVSV